VTVTGVRIHGLTEFRRALRAVDRAAARELTAGLKRAGEPAIRRAAELAPVRKGDLRGSYRARVAGPRAFLESAVPYGPGAEWGSRGKWRGFERLGPRGERIAGRAVTDEADAIFRIVTDELTELITIGGWAR
jgi:hypothetical protein